MKPNITFWRLLLFLFFGIILGLTIRNIYSLTAKQPCYWQNDPVLVNCAGADINEETIKRAVNFWREKGEHIYFYEYERVESICSSKKHVDGFIIITTQSTEILEKGVLASTSRRSKMGIIQSSIITFKPGRHNIILLLELLLRLIFNQK